MNDISCARLRADGLCFVLAALLAACGGSTGVGTGGGSNDGGSGGAAGNATDASSGHTGGASAGGGNAGGGSNTGGSNAGGNNAGGYNTGGNNAGGNNTGGNNTGGSTNSGGSSGAGGGGGGGQGGVIDAGQGCPLSEPALGTPCAPVGLRCVYGNICCGHGRECVQGGQWQGIPVGCACILMPDAGADAGACGTERCVAGQLCVHPPTSRGGPVPPCVAQPDAGQCPPGTELSSFCAGSPNGGCIETFVPDPPFCAPIPSTCGDPLQCSCFSTSLCGGGAKVCISVDRTDLRCADLAP